MNFSQLAQTFLAVQAESSRTAMTELLAHILKQATPQEAQIISYFMLGTLYAPYKGNQFNFAEKSLIKAVAELLKKDLDRYKTFVKDKADLGSALLVDAWPFKDTGLSVGQVYNDLEELMAISGTGSQDEKAQKLQSILTQLDVDSAVAVVRIVEGTMRLGLSDMTFLDALSWMVTGDKSLKKILEEAYNICADLGRIAFVLKNDGLEGVKALRPVLGIPIRLAAAERAESPQAIIDRLGVCEAQPKLDGFRLQIHIKNEGNETQIWFFSRNLLDMSSMFPDLKKVLATIPIKSLIIEGEAIVYDEDTERFLPFQETVKRRRKHDIDQVAESLPLRLYLFDILYLNGEEVFSRPHEERRALLVKLFGEEQQRVVHVIQEKRCTNVTELTDYFNEQITQGLEGLVVKRPDAPYQPGKRNFNWIKLKRHHSGSLVDSIDAVILGYYAGRGKRAAFGIGAFLVGVYNPEKEQYETIAKVGTGLTDTEWIDLKQQADTYAVSEKPQNVSCIATLEPDRWIQPHIVAVILADEITQSPSHTAGQTAESQGLALRFPRFMGYAADKTSQQATTVEELRRLYSLQFNTKS